MTYRLDYPGLLANLSMTDNIDAPADLADGWAIAAPDDQGMDSALLAGITLASK